MTSAKTSARPTDYAAFLDRKTHLGSEVYGAVLNGRKGMGAELKTAYYDQAVKNLAAVEDHAEQELIPV